MPEVINIISHFHLPEQGPSLELSAYFLVAQRATGIIDKLAGHETELLWWDYEWQAAAAGVSSAGLIRSAVGLADISTISYEGAQPYALNHIPLKEPIFVDPFFDGNRHVHIYQYHPTQLENIYALESGVELSLLPGANQPSEGLKIELRHRLLSGTQSKVKFAQNSSGEGTMVVTDSTHPIFMSSSDEITIIEYIPGKQITVEMIYKNAKQGLKFIYGPLKYTFQETKNNPNNLQG